MIAPTTLFTLKNYVGCETGSITLSAGTQTIIVATQNSSSDIFLAIYPATAASGNSAVAVPTDSGFVLTATLAGPATVVWITF